MKQIWMLVLCGLLWSGSSVAVVAQKTDQKRKVKTHITPSKQEEQPEAKGASIEFDRTNHNFGDVDRKGKSCTCIFTFTNVGDSPLVLTRVVTSCSCLKASFSKRPVAPNEKGEILITYEPYKSGAGAFNKVIRIRSNSVTKTDYLTVQGNSIDPKAVMKEKRGKVKVKIK